MVAQKFTSIHVSPDVRDKLRRAVIDVTTPAGRRVSSSDVLNVALDLIREEWDDVVGRLRGER